MNCKTFYLVISLFFLGTSISGETFIIGFDGILFKENKAAAIQELGIGTIFSKSVKSFFTSETAPWDMQDRFFKILDNIEPATAQTPVLNWHGKRVPSPICKHLINNPSDQPLLPLITEKIKKQKLSDESFVLSLANITFDPEKNADSLEEIPAGIQLLQELKNAGHTIYIVENWHPKTLEKLKAKYPHIFVNISSCIISGDTHKTKTSGLYEHFFTTTTNLDLNDAIVIETEQIYCNPIDTFNKQRSKNVKVILCQQEEYKKGFKYIKKQLRNSGYLPNNS